MKSIALSRPQITSKERRAVNKVLKSMSLAQDREVHNFEREFSKFVDERDCIAVNSGTSALLLCLISLGIGPGDEVLVPSFTFAATANVVCLTGARPVFVDIDPKTFNIDPNLLIQKISPRTRAILVVHLYGLPADMPKICKFASDHSLLVIEDAAQAHLAAIDGKKVGTFGQAAAFSFYPTKNMTSGEGGMIVVSDSEKARVCRLLRNQGMEKKYENEIIGYNLRMTEIHAAIGRIQLKKLPIMNERRAENAAFLTSKLETEHTPYTPRGFKHVFHQYTVRIKKERETVKTTLSNANISSAIYYPTPVHKLPSFNDNVFLPETDLAAKEVLSIPIHPGLRKRDLIRISECFNRAIK